MVKNFFQPQKKAVVNVKNSFIKNAKDKEDDFDNGEYKILDVIYINKNNPLKIKDIAVKSLLSEAVTSKYVNHLVEIKILKVANAGYAKAYYIDFSFVPKIFPLYDIENYTKLPMSHRTAIEAYIKMAQDGSTSFIVLFGLTEYELYKETKQLDLFEVCENIYENKDIIKEIESETSVNVRVFQISVAEFKAEIEKKEDFFVQNAIKTGFPVYNPKNFYDTLYSVKT